MRESFNAHNPHTTFIQITPNLQRHYVKNGRKVTRTDRNKADNVHSGLQTTLSSGLEFRKKAWKIHTDVPWINVKVQPFLTGFNREYFTTFLFKLQNKNGEKRHQCLLAYSKKHNLTLSDANSLNF